MTGRVVWVVDGDTIHVRVGSRLEKVRYIGIDAPEVPHEGRWWREGGALARAANRQLVGGQLVRLELEHGRVSREEHLLVDRGKRVRDVRQGPDGALYLVTDEDRGELWKIAPRR